MASNSTADSKVKLDAQLASQASATPAAQQTPSSLQKLGDTVKSCAPGSAPDAKTIERQLEAVAKGQPIPSATTQQSKDRDNVEGTDGDQRTALKLK